MSEVNFYLKEPKTKISAIYLQFKYKNQRLKYYFNQNIDSINWSSKKQRVKSNNQTTTDGQYSLNELLDNLKEVLLAAYRKELATGIPAKSKLKEALDRFINKNKQVPEKNDFYKLAEQFISGDIKNREGKDKSYHTIKTYKTVINHIKAFEKSSRYPINFSTINLEF